MAELLKHPAHPSFPFWEALDELVKTHEIVIDRPAGSSHPRDPNDIYPLDYGYLRDTSSNDGDGIDTWIGTQGRRIANAIVITVDLWKHDSEIKILLGCTKEETEVILTRHSQGKQSALLVERTVNDSSLDADAQRSN